MSCCQRRILGTSWTDRVTNAEVSSLTGLPDIISVIARRRHALSGHTRRLSRDTGAHRAFHLAVQLRQGTNQDASWRRPPSPLADRVTPGSVSSSRILASQQTIFGTSRPTERSGQLRPSAGSTDDDDDDGGGGGGCGGVMVKMTPYRCNFPTARLSLLILLKSNEWPKVILMCSCAAV